MTTMNYIKQKIPFRLRRFLLHFYPKTPLWKSLPLSHPLSIHIDPCNICNFKCIFCPTGHDDLINDCKRERSIMSMEIFKKAIDDFESLSKVTQKRLYHINLYKDGEPLLNENLFDMIDYAKNKRVANTISTTTNGSLLTKKVADNLVKTKIDLIRISVEHVNTEGYKRISKAKVTYEDIVQNVKTLYESNKKANKPCYILLKITDTGLSKNELMQFKNDFIDYCDEVRVDYLMGWSNSSASDFTLGTQPKVSMDGITKIHEQIVCPDPFSKLSINSNGTVSACCVDWSHGLLMGDIRKNTIEEIWNSDAYLYLRRKHLSGKRYDVPACSNCQFVQGTTKLENLDSHRNTLLQYY